MDILEALSNKKADVIYYVTSTGASLYYKNLEFVNSRISKEFNPSIDKYLMFRSYNSACKHLKEANTDGVILHIHDDGPYLVISHINDMVYGLWCDNEEGCRDDCYEFL